MLNKIVYVLLLSLTYKVVNSIPVHHDDKNSTSFKPMENPNLFEGDIYGIDEADLKGLAQLPNGWTQRWPFGIVPYVISSEYSASQRAAIIADMKMIEDATRSGNLKCITFVPRTNQVDYVRIVSKEGCYSEIGKRGGAQLLSLSIPGRCVYGGVIAHELVHALGFWHEQSRPDRDQYIKIVWNNIMDNMYSQFDKKLDSTDTMGFPYDYKSIMHYESTSFSKNGKDTIIPLQSGVRLTHASQKKVLSEIDVAEIKKFYSCV